MFLRASPDMSSGNSLTSHSSPQCGAEEEAKEAEAKAREEARAKAREELQNTSQTVDLEEQRLAMKQFGGDGMGGMMGNIDAKALKGDGQ